MFFEALRESTGTLTDTEDKETRRTQQFKQAFSKLLDELSEGLSGSSLTSQVRRYGAESVAAAQRESFDQAQKRVATSSSRGGAFVWVAGVPPA